MIDHRKIYCFSANNTEELQLFFQQQKQQSIDILPLKELLLYEEKATQKSKACAVIVRSGDEPFLLGLPKLCEQFGVSVGIFLTDLISDSCISRLHQSTATPLFCDMELLYKYSVNYLRQRIHLQVVYTDKRLDSEICAFLRENRVRMLLSSTRQTNNGIAVYTVTNTTVIPPKKQLPFLMLPIHRPLLTALPIAPFLAISHEDMLPPDLVRAYPTAEGLYALTSELCAKDSRMHQEENVPVDRLVTALTHGYYPILESQDKQEHLLVYGWDGSAHFFGIRISSPCEWKEVQLGAEQISLQSFLCSYIKPLSCCKETNRRQFLTSCLRQQHLANAFLQELYRKETTDEKEQLSLATFLQERILICQLLLKEAADHDLYLPDAEDYVMRVERYIRPVLHTLEQGSDPITVHNRLLMADGCDKVLFSEEQCILLYTEAMERQRRDMEWIAELRKKADKR